jgi:AcrR family transcriptional regulator
MPRVTKDAEVRREELLDVAFALCISEGFETTSVERITTAAGIAKGTFYHYFESKDDLLTQMVVRFGGQLLDHLESAMCEVEGDALVRLRTLMQVSSDWKLSKLDNAMAIIPVLYRDENYTLRHRLFSEWLARTRPLLREIVQQGVADGSFAVADPQATAEVILTLWYDFAGRLVESALESGGLTGYVDTVLRGAEAMLTAQERILGVPDGSTHVRFDEATTAAASAALKEMGDWLARSNDRRASK